MISIIIPAYNVEKSIGACLDALRAQVPPDAEIIVVDDGSRDGTRASAAARGVQVLTQKNAGAAAAGNAGVNRARGDIVLFLDGDCVPAPTWVAAMLAPFAATEIVGACGMKQTHQCGLVPRFIQLEFDYRYDSVRARQYIDFVDSGTAAYRRDVFLQNGGFDVTLADAEDVDLSYRLSERGYKLAFAAQAIVYDPHPESLAEYLRRKFEYAFWRTQVYARYPRKLASDSRTPQTQKLQGALAGAFLPAVCAALIWREAWWLVVLIGAAFGITTLPFVTRNFRRAPMLALIAPGWLALAAFAGGLGIALGVLKRRARAPTAKSPGSDRP